MSIKIAPPMAAYEAKIALAMRISDYTNGRLDESPQMLPVTVEDIFAKHIGFQALHYWPEGGVTFAGCVWATQPEEWQGQQMCEVGTLWVPKEFRGQGIAHGLVTKISQVLVAEGKLPYAFCNPKSKPVFKDVGYAVAEATDLPPSVFDGCVKCPMQPARGCCDEFLVYGGSQ